MANNSWLNKYAEQYIENRENPSYLKTFRIMFNKHNQEKILEKVKEIENELRTK